MSYVLSLIKLIEEAAGESPCKKKVQKIVYLIKESKQAIEFDFSIHFFGPYSRELDSEIRYLYDCGNLEINITEFEHKLSVKNGESVIAANQDATINIINKFVKKTPSELELLATTLYVQREISYPNKRTIIAGVTKIKGNKYTEQQIEAAIQELGNADYFDAL